MQPVAWSHAGSGQTASHDSRPSMNIAAGVADHGGFARCATGGVDADHLIGGNSEHPKWVVLAQIFFLGEGQQAYIRQRLNVAGLDAKFIHRIPIVFDGLIATFDGGAEPAQLQRLQVLAG